MFAEKESGLRQLEVPVLVDVRGTAWAAGVIDVTLRHRGRVLVAEAPPQGLSAEAERTARATAAGLAQGSDGAGVLTVRFLADPKTGEVRFQEKTPGLPAEFAVAEALTGLDLTSLQYHLRRGGKLTGEAPEPRGHAFQVCLSARDPEDGFAPCLGVVEVLRLAAGPGLRADAAVEEGDSLLPEADPALVRLTASARSRPEALTRLQNGLARTTAVVRGGSTDKAFLTEIVDRAEVSLGKAGPDWVERLIERGEHLSRRGVRGALLAAAVAGYDAELDQAKAGFYAAARRGRPEVPREAGRTVELRHRGHAYSFLVARLASDLYRLTVDGTSLEARVGPTRKTGRRITCGRRTWHVSLDAHGDGLLLVEVDGVPHRVGRDTGSVVRSPAPALVVSLAAKGSRVAEGDTLAVLETMKVETSVRAPGPGRVRKVLARRNAQVGTGTPLLVLDPVEEAADPPAGERARFAPLAGVSTAEDTNPVRGQEELEACYRLLLGYDIDPAALRKLVAPPARKGSKRKPAADSNAPETRRRERLILETFVDLASLFRRQARWDLALEDDDRHSSEEYLFTFLRDLDVQGAGLPPAFLHHLGRALAHYGVESLDRSPELEESLFRIAVSHRRQAQLVPPILAVLERLLDGDLSADGELRALLDRLIAESQGREPAVHDLAREVRWRVFDLPLLQEARDRIYAEAEADLARLAEDPPPEERGERIRSLVERTPPLHARLSQRYAGSPPSLQHSMLEVMVRRYYRLRELGTVRPLEADGLRFAVAEYSWQGGRIHLFATHAAPDGIPEALAAARRLADGTPGDRSEEKREVVVDLYAWQDEPPADEDATAAEIGRQVEAAGFPGRMTRVAVALASPGGMRHFTYRRADGGDLRYPEERVYRGLHPMMAQRLQIWRFRNFHLEQLPAPDGIWLFQGVAHTNPRDERLFAVAEVRDLTPVRDGQGRVIHLPQVEHRFMEALAGIRRFQSRRPAGERLQWNRVLLYLWPPVDLRPDELNGLVRRMAPLTEGLGLEKVAVRGRMVDPQSGAAHDRVLEISNPGEAGMVLRIRPPKEAPLKPLREYAQKIVELKRRGIVYAYEIVRLLAPPEPQEGIPAGVFVEHDLDGSGERLVPVERPFGENAAGIVAGVIRSITERHPEGMERVILLGDASRDLGALAEPECRRILAALDLAAEKRVPVEWFALSAGARIARDSGTENMDWIARVLRRIVERTLEGLEINIVVPGINAGAQPYWNAEATMLMHTRGILIMTPQGAMVLTGKRALDYSGGVSAEDDLGIGGYERIMGPNGQAQYFARDLGEACQILLRHYEHSWVAPGERFPRPAPTGDPRDRDVCDFPHGGNFRTVGEVFSEAANPGRKKPFEIRRVMQAVIDQDHKPLERWYGMRGAEVAVVWDAHLGGRPVCLLGFESKPLPRLGWVPVYGPDQWTGGTLFPLSSKKVARAIHAASGSRPLVILANLSGFDGSPESLRAGQLELGAEIGRAVVGFRGPIVFCVISRYHGGAFVVFSHALHDNLEVAALEGSHASVIGGAPAAAVIFAREVDRRTRQDPRVAGRERPEEETIALVRSEKLGEVAEELDRIHSVERAREVGSIHRILPPRELRPYLIDAVERGMAKEVAGA